MDPEGQGRLREGWNISAGARRVREALDLDRHRLSLSDADCSRFAAAQKAIAKGRIDPGLARYDRLRFGIDRALGGLGVDLDAPAAIKVRADARNELTSFEAIEGRAPNGEDIDAIVKVRRHPRAEPNT